MKIEPLAEYLESEGIAKAGKDLFAYYMPDSVSEGILLISSLEGTPIDTELPGYRKTGFQVIIRHDDHVKGRALADQVSSALTMSNTTLTDMYVNYIRPRHEPVVFPSSEGDFLEFSVNYDANYVMA